MFYAFFLFWPANVIPMWLIITLLQLFIPLNLFLRSCCVGLKHHKIHIYSSLIILVGVGVNLGDLGDPIDSEVSLTLEFNLRLVEWRNSQVYILVHVECCLWCDFTCHQRGISEVLASELGEIQFQDSMFSIHNRSSSDTYNPSNLSTFSLSLSLILFVEKRRLCWCWRRVWSLPGIWVCNVHKVLQCLLEWRCRMYILSWCKLFSLLIELSLE